MSRDLIDETWVAIADGEKALILRNDDTNHHPVLSVIKKEEIDNPPNREQAANRRGRMPDNGAQQRSAVQDTDWHELGKERFNKAFADILNRAALNNAFDRLLLIAPPQTLGRLRTEFHQAVAERIIREEPSNLTNHPMDEIEAQVAKLLGHGEPDYDQDLRRTS